jgi:hypothetical protein
MNNLQELDLSQNFLEKWCFFPSPPAKAGSLLKRETWATRPPRRRKIWRVASLVCRAEFQSPALALRRKLDLRPCH